jgi:hypothetical protein
VEQHLCMQLICCGKRGAAHLGATLLLLQQASTTVPCPLCLQIDEMPMNVAELI